MKQIIAVRSNSFLWQDETEKEISFTPTMELVIIHTQGKDYTWTKDGTLSGKSKLNEMRLLVDPELLQNLITDLQLHQKKLQAFTHNANEINSLLRHISSTAQL
jgi:hypothetical protein